MKSIIYAITVFGFLTAVDASDTNLENYVKSFDYEARKEMKINSKKLVELLKQGDAQLIDIRFTEEYSVWKVEPSRNIPLNELPKRLLEIDKSKTVVTACPHKDRAIIAMVYLRSQGIEAKYLTDGLIGLAQNLRGDNAKELLDALEKLKDKKSTSK